MLQMQSIYKKSIIGTRTTLQLKIFSNKQSIGNFNVNCASTCLDLELIIFLLQGIQDGSNWPNLCSICLSMIICVLCVENHINDWTAKFVYTPIFHNSLTVTRSIGIASLVGILCQVYQCLNAMDKLSAITLLLWSSVFVINNFEILNHFQPKVFLNSLI